MISMPYGNNFPTPLPNPIKLPDPLPIKPSVEVKKEIDQQTEKVMSQNDIVKNYFESKTSALLIEHQRGNLELFKSIHTALVQIENKVEACVTSITNLANAMITSFTEVNTTQNNILNQLQDIQSLNAKTVVSPSTPKAKPSMTGPVARINSGLIKKK